MGTPASSPCPQEEEGLPTGILGRRIRLRESQTVAVRELLGGEGTAAEILGRRCSMSVSRELKQPSSCPAAMQNSYKWFAQPPSCLVVLPLVIYIKFSSTSPLCTKWWREY